MGNFRIALETTTDRFRVLLPVHGFGAEPRRETDAAYRRIWERVHRWKTDAIEIVYRRGGEQSLLINFGVWLQVPDCEESMLFDCRGVGTPRIPTSPWQWVMRRYVNKVTRAVEGELRWFDSFATPEACLGSLSNPDRNVPRQGKNVDLMCDYLRSVGGGQV